MNKHYKKIMKMNPWVQCPQIPSVQKLLESISIVNYVRGEGRATKRLKHLENIYREWVKDIVDGIYLTSIADDKDWNEEWNIGNEKNERTILYLAERVKEITGTSSEIVNVDPVELHGPLFAEAPEKIPNSEKIKERLGWQATKGVDEVIQEVVEYYQSGVCV